MHWCTYSIDVFSGDRRLGCQYRGLHCHTLPNPTVMSVLDGDLNRKHSQGLGVNKTLYLCALLVTPVELDRVNCLFIATRILKDNLKICWWIWAELFAT